MSKEIIPNKLIVSLNEDGSVKDSVLHYRLRTDGVMDNKKFYTIGVKAGVKIADLDSLIGKSIIHAEKGEEIIKEV